MPRRIIIAGLAVVRFFIRPISTGEDSYNQSLSERRARAVLDYLTQNFQGIDLDRLFPKGFGETRPIATHDTAEGRAKNRRVEFRVLNR